MPVLVEKQGLVTVVTIDRPEVRNAVDRDTAQKLADAFRAFDASDSSVAVLTGAGGHFCAGADLKAIASGAPNRLDPEGDAPMGPSRMLLGKPVIAAIAGSCVAGGLELACWCDLRVVEEDARLGFLERRWGVPLIDGGTVRLPLLIGLSRALDLILTGRAIDAAEAHAIGLANRVVQKGRARDEAIALGNQLAAFPQACMRGDRRSALEAAALQQAMRREFEIGFAALMEGELGAARFAEGAGRGGKFE